MTQIPTKSNGTILPKKGLNFRIPYDHQKKAMACLDAINQRQSYSTLLVLPTGGGKTYTASLWLLKNALDKKKKILWIAHRQLLLEQAVESFQNYAYAEVLLHISSFNYRVISGSTSHDRVIDIKPTDNLLIVSKDSIGRNLEKINAWIKGEEEIFLIIDEAHHSTAKTYRKIIEYVKNKVKHVKLIGLTATPFRTAENEKGLLAKIYTDGLEEEQVGIAYKIDLKELINRQILSKPIFERYFSEESYGDSMGLEEWEHIQQLDVIPENIASQMVGSAIRNKLIIDTYKKNQKTYGQTIVFAVNITHAISLCKLFKDAGIEAEYIVSDIRDMATGINITRKENEEKIQKYKSGKVQILINVNILTEGVDLPQTKTVFLARPTVSTILMTQMIGRALRGTKAGGTSSAYIVSFIDNWDEHIAWVNPESLFVDDNDFVDSESDRSKRDISLIAISKIEEFASILDASVDSTALEKIPFEKRIPVGMYAFSYLEESGMDLSYQVMVYDSTQKAYEDLMEAIPVLFQEMGVTEEYPEESVIHKMVEECKDAFFCGEMIPSFDERDIASILRYYAVYEEVPPFYTFDEIDRSRLDVAKIAENVIEQDMTPLRRRDYINELWDAADDNVLKLFFGRKLYFTQQLDIEVNKILAPELWDELPNVKYGTRKLEDMPLSEIKKYDLEMEKKLRDGAFEASRNKDGMYECACCHRVGNNRILFQVDHIIPMNKGGKSRADNLQILCRKCNGEKGERV